MRTCCLILLGSLLFLFGGKDACAQPACTPDQDRLLMIGDSWYGIMYAANSYGNSFEKYGFPDMRHSENGPVINGATLELSVQPLTLTLIEQSITDNPDIDIVGISLGGNDLLGGWSADMWSFQQDAFFSTLRGYIHTLVNRIQAARPGIHVFFSGYDYPNFVETRLYIGSPYHAQWENMGEPSVLELNSALARLEQLKIDLANQRPEVHYVHSMGLMQYIYGYPIGLPEAPYLPFDPGVVPFPGQEADNYQPYPGGLNVYPSPLAALNWGGLDGIHLTEEAYQHLADHQTKYFFFDFFRDYPDAVFNADAGNSGWVDQHGATGTDVLKVGKRSDGTAVHGLLTFNTAGLPDDAVVENASIFLTRSGLNGLNPFDADIGQNSLDAVGGAWGEIALEAADFDAAGGSSDIGCFRGHIRENGHYLRIDLGPDALQQINASGTTQFRLRSEINAPGSDALPEFSVSGASAPFLDIHYSTLTSAFGNTIESIHPVLYPNPGRGLYTITWNGGAPPEYMVTVFDVAGKQVYETRTVHGMQHPVDLTECARGIYLVSVKTAESTATIKLIHLGE